eukprot:CAMPEP_0119079122 /NCGR_PEP_ID=MMETSP1178-20130426/105021_1 /TAXON_ID=33656 /ORGANISM="unid sp, Strain CCMP2000" /LENGTH=33 /DNA_ID= /DNA_START= /DNA_END= /DNA_ORIENTATION=
MVVVVAGGRGLSNVRCGGGGGGGDNPGNTDAVA